MDENMAGNITAEDAEADSAGTVVDVDDVDVGGVVRGLLEL